MPQEIAAPTINEHGEEVHPAFGLISVSRSQTGPVGATLFDSDIQHRNTVTVTVRKAERKRDLHHDFIHPQSRQAVLSEVQMSEAQWASFVSSMNTGNGVPCTIRTEMGNWSIPGLPYEPRLAESMEEVRTAGDKAIEDIRRAFEVAAEKPNKTNMRHLKAMIDNAPSNMTFAAKSLSDHAENVVQKARVDVEAMVLAHAQKLGLNPADLGGMPQIGPGSDG